MIPPLGECVYVDTKEALLFWIVLPESDGMRRESMEEFQSETEEADLSAHHRKAVKSTLLLKLQNQLATTRIQLLEPTAALLGSGQTLKALSFGQRFAISSQTGALALF